MKRSLNSNMVSGDVRSVLNIYRTRHESSSTQLAVSTREIIKRGKRERGGGRGRGHGRGREGGREGGGGRKTDMSGPKKPSMKPQK